MLRLCRRAVKRDFAGWSKQCPPEWDAAQEELSVLGSIEARYADEPARLVQSGFGGTLPRALSTRTSRERKLDDNPSPGVVV
jgi:hypothetical protein